ncbi:hypothetical protein NL529_28465, partial [Klebsiella pneumoniae]|nr:hypothetical protein [Klebsiella pneumoniae]
LFIAILQLIPGLTNIDPWSSIGPLLFVLGVTAIKEGNVSYFHKLLKRLNTSAYEDIRRWKSDNGVNNTMVHVLHEGQFIKIPWKRVTG